MCSLNPCCKAFGDSIQPIELEEVLDDLSITSVITKLHNVSGDLKTPTFTKCLKLLNGKYNKFLGMRLKHIFKLPFTANNELFIEFLNCFTNPQWTVENFKQKSKYSFHFLIHKNHYLYQNCWGFRWFPFLLIVHVFIEYEITCENKFSLRRSYSFHKFGLFKLTRYVHIACHCYTFLLKHWDCFMWNKHSWIILLIKIYP